MSAPRVIICDTSGQPSKPARNEPDRRQFVHQDDCQCHGFLSLLNARHFKRIGHCRCDVPMEDEATR